MKKLLIILAFMASCSSEEPSPELPCGLDDSYVLVNDFSRPGKTIHLYFDGEGRYVEYSVVDGVETCRIPVVVR